MEQRFFDDALTRKYLLGELSQDELEQIEQRLLVDEDFGEEVSMTRTEMVDDYVAESLSPNEREKFEKHFLSTPEHAQMVEIGRALAKRLEDSGRDPKLTRNAVSRIPPPYNRRYLGAIVSLTAAALLLVTGYVAWELIKQRNSNYSASEAQEQRAALEKELIKLNRPGSDLAQNAYAVVPFNLKPILLRDLGGENRSVAISKDPRILEVRLELPSDKYQHYRASLETGEGFELAAIDALTAKTVSNGNVVVLALPSWLMPPGSYQIKLTGLLGSGQSADITLYPFEITNQ